MGADTLSAWDDARRLADELEVEVYLASMDARARWHKLEGRLCKLDKAIVRSGEQIGEVIVRELYELRAAPRALRDDLSENMFDDRAAG